MNFIEQRNERILGIWLMICCLVLLALVVVGGATRLTGSGLSMVDWQPVTGFIPPMNEEAWMREFDAYRQSPEYQKVNVGMSLDDFKVIYWWEFGHRLLARALGLIFALPLIAFWWRGMIPRRLRWPLVGLFALGALQGYMGWYMVQSGLVDIPRVSPYRLAIHLTLALIIYAIMFRMALGLLWPAPSREVASPWRRWTIALLALVAVTIVSGAFVAGLKAGLVYNTFPLMAGRWIPEGLLGLEPVWRNFFENTATVQFTHRLLALTTLALAAIAWFRVRRGETDPGVRIAFHALLTVALAQAALGIATLLLYVPVTLGTFHQGMAVVLLSAALFADYRASRRPAPTEEPAHSARLASAAG